MPNFKRGMMGAAGAGGGGGGELWIWGGNAGGVLGLSLPPYTQSKSSPTQVGALDTWTYIKLSNQNIAKAIRSDGTLWSWGRALGGSHGDNTATTHRSSPIQVGAGTDWLDAKISGGWDVAAIKSTGTLWTWGRDYFGAGGHGTNSVARSSPAQVGALDTWVQVANGLSASPVLAIRSDGTLWSWGRNNSGEGGHGDTVARSSPVQVGALTTWASVSAGATNAAAIKTDGTLWTWGTSPNGENGRSSVVASSSPIQVGALTDWAQVSCGTKSVFAVKTNGTLWAWGNANPGGGLGLNDSVDRSSPTQIGALTTWASVHAGDDHASALKTDGTLWGWGDNSAQYGSSGHSTLNDISSPVQVGALDTWVSHGCGGPQTAGIKTP